ncbi:glycosyltransferase [Alkalihalobacterium chitinilyticum]|uniref:Glycosyltransferase n=1 Tax=Alkalihalobacterium chitinilyticum TaxID=2980103 RepID=A0ABT5VEB6_9BACI|nr:glycosyltransferase [Alkalihalobacterium chitinilyticum]MDE5413793.1 glycosyltransferase [Alkalihalobacterium chitinilyticum]
MEYKVSVIVPVYNAEQFLSQCIKSLLNQTLQQCEFIFINDGSIDDSEKIIKEYKKKDSRIKLVNQENQGVSIARNTGIEIASGEYIGFVDADDYIESDMYKQMYTKANTCKCDAVITNFESEIEGHKVITTYPFPENQVLDRTFIEDELLPFFLKSETLNTACNKIYFNKRINENHIRFPEKVALGEDGMFNMQFFCSASNVKYLNYTGYHYREVNGSATRNILSNNYFVRALEVYNLELPPIYLKKLSKERVQELKATKLINSVLSYIYIYFSASKELSFKDRYSYVSEMIGHPVVRDSISSYVNEVANNLGRYDKLLIQMIKRKATFALYCATAYSKLRNQRFGGS